MEGVLKRSVRIAGHRTSVSLEAPFWEALRELAAGQGRSVQGLIAGIDAGRESQNLSSAIRVFVLARAKAGELGSSGSEVSTRLSRPAVPEAPV